ncbi:MAG: SRPBCC domain-containing protein [Shimia sp.]
MSHETFSLTRDIAAPTARVWRLWSEPELKAGWFAHNDGSDWTTEHYEMTFAVGGGEYGRWRQGGDHPAAKIGGLHENRTTYLSIEAPHRIVMAYTMALDGAVHSCSLATVTLSESARCTRLTYTETMSPVGQGDTPEARSAGVDWLLDALQKTAETPDN